MSARRLRLGAVSVLRLAEVRDRLPELVAAVGEGRDRVTVTDGGRAAAVLISAGELRTLEETADVLANAELSAAIVTARAEVRAGRVATGPELAAAMRGRQSRAGADRAGSSADAGR
jgi:prevent-host-death family protein